MIIRWTSEARTDRRNQIEWRAERNPRAAASMDAKVEQSVRLLGDFPEIGRPTNVADTRELSVTGTPYIVVHRLTSATVQILRLYHSSQDRLGWR